MTTAIGETVTDPPRKVVGGLFLCQEVFANDVLTLESLSTEQELTSALALAFADREVVPRIQDIEAKGYILCKKLLRESARAGLTALEVPKFDGGLGADKVSAVLIADRMFASASFSTTFSAHVDLGMQPLFLFGTSGQKRKYLPRLISAEWVAAFALSEPTAGSDAMSIRTSAVLSSDGQHYILNGKKRWITNAGIADLFTVFVRVDGEHFAALLVEADTPGLTIEEERPTLGIRGSSTCPLIFSNCMVPVGNLIGDVGKGHAVAFSVLNFGRCKLAASAVGAARRSLNDAISFAKDRIAFGQRVTDFGLSQQKIAESAAELYATEAALYRTVGNFDRNAQISHAHSARDAQKEISHFVVECSILKVWASEMLERTVDRMLQLHGGAGYLEGCTAERSYRDSRINKIVEGTNEINRLLIAEGTLKQLSDKTSLLSTAVEALMNEIRSSEGREYSLTPPTSLERSLLTRSKKLGLLCLGVIHEKFGSEYAEHQELQSLLADLLADTYMLESAILRTEKTMGASELANQLLRYLAPTLFRRISNAAQDIVIESISDTHFAAYKKTVAILIDHPTSSTIQAGRYISAAIVENGGYGLSIH